eukprot:849677-Rhodomonas_salina.1
MSGVLVSERGRRSTQRRLLTMRLRDNVKDYGYVKANCCYGQKGGPGGKKAYYLDCEVIEPVKHWGHIIQLTKSKLHLTKQQVARGMSNDYVWWICKLLDVSYNEPTTLEDLGLTMTNVEQVNQVLLNLYCGAPTTTLAAKASIALTGELADSGEPTPPMQTGPFQDQQRNEIWRVFASQMQENYEQLADVDMQEPSPAYRNEAMRNALLKPFWIQLEEKEMTGLWTKGCFKRWKRKDLACNNWVFASQFHYNIKRDGATGQITNCKVWLVVMGNRMKEGEDYEDAFTPVPHATSGRIMISLAAVLDLKLHSCDLRLAQAFIHADKLEEGVNGLVFIRPPQGSTKDTDTVFEVCRPLYGIPSSAPPHTQPLVQGTGFQNGGV